ncbi:hypothetical protein ZWY2020_041016 [Hordeum vulgare]|nr:hypothetical protein ZWY2020_041016 [Hordeum vulgare]
MRPLGLAPRLMEAAPGLRGACVRASGLDEKGEGGGGRGVFDSAGEPVGFNLYVGGGMGRTHIIETTFPRLADPLGYVPKEDILYAIKAIVVTQRENGRRDNRRYSKSSIRNLGIDKFWAEAEKYYGKKFEDFRPLREWQFNNYLGWQEQGDGKLFYGVHIDNGHLGTRKANLLGASQTQW